MMKHLFSKFSTPVMRKKTSQARVIEFVHNTKNIEKATEGSMQKRIDLINRVKLQKVS